MDTSGSPVGDPSERENGVEGLLGMDRTFPDK